MNVIQRIESWGDTHQPKWLAVFRIILGVVIFMKGLSFLENRDAIIEMIQNSAVAIYAIGLAHYVALAHLMGGLLIAIGLLTRLAIGFQIPILLGAIIFINSRHGFFSIHPDSELILSVLILALLLFFFVFGSGKFSVDEFMSKHEHT
jgi:putative oxidoreductase